MLVVGHEAVDKHRRIDGDTEHTLPEGGGMPLTLLSPKMDNAHMKIFNVARLK